MSRYHDVKITIRLTGDEEEAYKVFLKFHETRTWSRLIRRALKDYMHAQGREAAKTPVTAEIPGDMYFKKELAAGLSDNKLQKRGRKPNDGIWNNFGMPAAKPADTGDTSKAPRTP